MPNLDQFFFRQVTPAYNCWNHAQEVWRELTREELTVRSHSHYKQLPAPTSPCIVFMQHQFYGAHVGIYYAGSIMHLVSEGVQYQPVQTVLRYYPDARFYR